jgi:hypothetical protein
MLLPLARPTPQPPRPAFTYKPARPGRLATANRRLTPHSLTNLLPGPTPQPPRKPDSPALPPKTTTPDNSQLARYLLSNHSPVRPPGRLPSPLAQPSLTSPLPGPTRNRQSAAHSSLTYKPAPPPRPATANRRLTPHSSLTYKPPPQPPRPDDSPATRHLLSFIPYPRPAFTYKPAPQADSPAPSPSLHLQACSPARLATPNRRLTPHSLTSPLPRTTRNRQSAAHSSLTYKPPPRADSPAPSPSLHLQARSPARLATAFRRPIPLFS